MTDKQHVLDASAVPAAFFDEPGADIVAERMAGALLSAVNFHEVVAKLVDRGSPPSDIVDIMAQRDVEVVPFPRRQWPRASFAPRRAPLASRSAIDRVLRWLRPEGQRRSLPTRLELEFELEVVR